MTDDRKTDWRTDPPPGTPPGLGSTALAFRIAAHYPHRVPTVQELMDRYGMSQATAYRWQASMRAGRGGRG